MKKNSIFACKTKLIRKFSITVNTGTDLCKKYHNFWRYNRPVCLCVLTTLRLKSAKNPTPFNGIERKSQFLFFFFFFFFLVLQPGCTLSPEVCFKKRLFCSSRKVFFDKTTKTIRIKKTVSAYTFANKCL